MLKTVQTPAFILFYLFIIYLFFEAWLSRRLQLSSTSALGSDGASFLKIQNVALIEQTFHRKDVLPNKWSLAITVFSLNNKNVHFKEEYIIFKNVFC